MKSLLALLVLCWIKDNPGLGSPENTCAYYYDKKIKKNLYTSVNVEPEFPGGAAACMRFLNRNLRYPAEQIESGELQSAAILKFIVNTDGQIKNITVNDKDSTNMTPFEKEVFRVIKLMPRWTPGKCNGKTMATIVKYPLSVHPAYEE
jgi:protein TonB